MSFQKFATVNIIGGLGNQLHQFAFIKYLENKGFKLRVNLDWYKVDEHEDGTIPRKFELNIKNFTYTCFSIISISLISHKIYQYLKDKIYYLR